MSDRHRRHWRDDRCRARGIGGQGAVMAVGGGAEVGGVLAEQGEAEDLPSAVGARVASGGLRHQARGPG